MSVCTARLVLLTTAALALPAAHARADDNVGPDGERDYLPSEILVIGQIDDYASTDGSTGTKTPTALIDVPQTVQVITSDQLEDQAITQLGEALRYVPGVSLETGEGHRDEIFIRGQETTADFYLDGLRDDAQYYRPLYNVERIEVLKGANALIFGRGGGGGVINRVSKTAKTGDSFTYGTALVDSFGAFSLALDTNQPVSDAVAVRINGAYEEFASNRDFYNGRFIGISPTLTARLSDATRLIASYTYDSDRRVTDRGVPNLGSGPLTGYDDTFFGDADFNQSDSQVHIARARLEHDFSASLSANASVQYANYDKAYANILPRSTNGTTVEFSGYRDTQDRENLIGQANLVWELDTGGMDHTVLAGVEFSRQDSHNGRADTRFANPLGGAPTSRFTVALDDVFSFPLITLAAPNRDRESQLDVFSAYVQDQIAIGEIIQIIAGVRYDRFDLQTVELLTGARGDRLDEKVSPRVGLILKPDANLSVYGSYAQSFLPQAGDQFQLLSPGDAAFEPEKFTNIELGVKWALRPDLFLTGAVFQLERTNTQAADPSNSGLTILAGESRVRGMELNLVGEILPGWQANIGYTYLDGEITESSEFGPQGTRLQQLPEHQFAAWNHVDLTEKFSIGLGVIHQDEQFASFSNSVVLPDYWRIDAAAYYQVSERLSLQLNVENALDANYYPSAHGDSNIQPGKPLSARVGVRFSL